MILGLVDTTDELTVFNLIRARLSDQRDQERAASVVRKARQHEKSHSPADAEEVAAKS